MTNPTQLHTPDTEIEMDLVALARVIKSLDDVGEMSLRRHYYDDLLKSWEALTDLIHKVEGVR